MIGLFFELNKFTFEFWDQVGQICSHRKLQMFTTENSQYPPHRLSMKMTAFSLLKLRFSNVCISTHDLMEIQKTLTIARGYARSILDGKKHYEARLWNDRLGELNVGAKLCFHWYGKERLLCSISEVLTFDSIRAMLGNLNTDLLLPGLDLADGSKDACDPWIEFWNQVVKYQNLKLGLKGLWARWVCFVVWICLDFVLNWFERPRMSTWIFWSWKIRTTGWLCSSWKTLCGSTTWNPRRPRWRPKPRWRRPGWKNHPNSSGSSTKTNSFSATSDQNFGQAVSWLMDIRNCGKKRTQQDSFWGNLHVTQRSNDNGDPTKFAVKITGTQQSLDNKICTWLLH